MLGSDYFASDYDETSRELRRLFQQRTLRARYQCAAQPVSYSFPNLNSLTTSGCPTLRLSGSPTQLRIEATHRRVRFKARVGLRLIYKITSGDQAARLMA